MNANANQLAIDCMAIWDFFQAHPEYMDSLNKHAEQGTAANRRAIACYIAPTMNHYYKLASSIDYEEDYACRFVPSFMTACWDLAINDWDVNISTCFKVWLRIQGFTNNPL